MRTTMIMESTGSTWGIPGPVFLTGYWLLCGALAVMGVRWYRAGETGTVKGPGLQLTPEMAALVLGGRERAFRTAVSRMAQWGMIEGSHTHFRCNDAPAPTTPLEQAIATSLRRNRLPSQMRSAPEVVAALDAMTDHLSRTGLLMTPERRAAFTRLAVWGTTLWVVGFVRMVAGIANNRPTGYLLLTLVGLPFGLWALRAAAARQTPPRARMLMDSVKELEARASLLQPHETAVVILPDGSWVHVERATLEAIRSTSPLYVANPGLAYHLGITGPTAAAATWTGTASTGGGGGWFSFGGGSDLSGGGGDSSSGGGGCGGGGCGGGGGGGGGCGG